MAGNFQGEFSSNLSFDSSFSVLTSDDINIEEPERDEDVNDKEVIVIEERVVSPVCEQEFITLEELADSDFIRNRQLAAKSIVEHLHQAGSNKEALHSVISVMCKLSEDEDIMVRSELIEQIPSIALFCKEHSEDLGVVIRQQIVPYTVKLLTDIQKQIRKTGHSILIVLLENNVIDHSQLSEWICPLIAQLVTTESIPQGLKAEDVSVMCKMIPYIGKEITEKFFLEPFLTICRDTSSAREVCFTNFGTISQVIGQDATEKTLLSAFLDLCQEQYDVKIKCVDIAVDLATAVSSTTRTEILSPVYMSFLKDESVIVSKAAYLSLGRFISTFAEPSKTGLKYKDGMWINEDGENDSTDDMFQNIQQHQGQFFESLTSGIISTSDFLDEFSFENLNNTFDQDSEELSSLLPTSNFNNCKLQFEESEVLESSRYSSSDTFCNNVLITNFKNLTEINKSTSKHSNLSHSLNNEKQLAAISTLNNTSKDQCIRRQASNENIFNNFQFWRMPLPEVDLDIEECKQSNLRTDLEEEKFSCSSKLVSTILPKQNSKEPYILQDTDDSKLNKEDGDTPELNLKNLYVQFTKKKPFNFLKEHQRNVLFFKEKPDNQISLNEKHMTDTEKMVYDQDIVPPELLMEYINEISISENDVKRLTFYFPSVAYALGRKHWSCIRDLFNTISSMPDFNIKKTVASSLHELAIILGPEITTEDLLPIFLKMLRDVSVRYSSSSLMENLSKFLKKTKPEARRQFLPRIEELCSWDSEDRNWRYRLTVSEQLILCVELFSSHEALRFLPASLLIMQDKVFAVRRSGVELLAVILKSIATDAKSSIFIKATLCALDDRCRKSNKWLWRQLYIFICQDLAAKRSLSTEFYVQEIVPNLFSLTWDAVPNVRLAVARCIALTLIPLDYISSIEKTHFTLLFQVLYSLQSDVDKDVKYFGHLCAAASNIFKSNTVSLDEESGASQFKESEE